MEDDEKGGINELFEENDSIPIENQLWGKNPKRVEALRDIWFKDMTEFMNENNVPEKGRNEMVFNMAINSLLDMILESLPVEDALEMTYAFDHMIGVFIANNRYGVDILDAAYQSMTKVNRDDFDSDEDFENAIAEREEKWWTVGKQILSGRSPNDVIIEALSRYGLNR
jgi:hypothetical protein